MRENADEAGLPDHEILRARFIGQNVERAGDNAIEPRVEEMAWSGGELLEKDSQGVGGVEARHIGFPGIRKRSIGGRLEAGVLELSRRSLAVSSVKRT